MGQIKAQNLRPLFDWVKYKKKNHRFFAVSSIERHVMSVHNCFDFAKVPSSSVSLSLDGADILILRVNPHDDDDVDAGTEEAEERRRRETVSHGRSERKTQFFPRRRRRATWGGERASQSQFHSLLQLKSN